MDEGAERRGPTWIVWCRSAALSPAAPGQGPAAGVDADHLVACFPRVCVCGVCGGADGFGSMQVHAVVRVVVAAWGCPSGGEGTEVAASPAALHRHRRMKGEADSEESLRSHVLMNQVVQRWVQGWSNLWQVGA